MEESRPQDPGLCGHCAHARVQENRRGSRFWRCDAGGEAPAPPRYPPLPVRACPAHREGEPRVS